MPRNFERTKTTISPNARITKVTEEELLNDEDIETVMRRKLGTKNFLIKNWTLDNIPLTNGFLGRYHNLRVTCSLNDGNDVKFVFFAKTKPPINSSQYELAVSGNVFKREITFYEDLASKMGNGEGPKWKVDCYLGKSDVIIILEDATLEGFTMPDKFVPFERDECVTMLRSFAKLHSRSLILDEKLRRENGQSLDDVYGEILEEGLFPSADRTSRNIIGSGVQGACGLVDLMECFDDRSKRRVKNLIADWSWRIPRLVRKSKKYRNVICHRDPWANNMMIKRDSLNGRATNFYLIDFQFIRYLPPAIDFMLSLYLTTRRKTRDENFEIFAKSYHDNVREELRRENLDIDECNLSWNVFRESCEYYRSLAIIYVTVNQQIMLIDDNAADKYFTKTPELLERVLWGYGRQELVCPIFAACPRYRERLTENIMEIHEKLDSFDDWNSDDF